MANILFHQFDMPRAHGDCQFRDDWPVHDKYKEWVVKDGDPRLARCQLCKLGFLSSNVYFLIKQPWPLLKRSAYFTIIAIVHIVYSTNFCERLCFTRRNGSVDSIVNKMCE